MCIFQFLLSFLYIALLKLDLSLSKTVSPHFSHTCSGAVFLLLQNISFPEWSWNISFCFSNLLTFWQSLYSLTSGLRFTVWPQKELIVYFRHPQLIYMVWHRLWFCGSMASYVLRPSVLQLYCYTVVFLFW